MEGWLTVPVLAVLGFFLGYFYTRTMRLAERLPEEYASKEDCRAYRLECHHAQESDRLALLERMDRMESKLDRIIEYFIQAGIPGRQA